MERNDTLNKGYLFDVSKSLENGSKELIGTNIYDTPFKDNEQKSEDAGKIRLQYAAATRAKNVLIIANLVKKDLTSSQNPWMEILSAEASKNLKDIETVLANVTYITDYSKEKVSYNDIEMPENIIEKTKKDY